MKLNQKDNEIKNKEFSEDLKAMAASPDVVRRICLPVDVVQQEILTRLPVKHLLRCKLLSREYNSLIKNPSFIKKHLLRQQSSSTNNKIVVVAEVEDGKTPGGILSVLSSSSSPDMVYVPDPARSHRLRLVGSCNGLLCGSFQPPGYSKLRLMLWNPATRNRLILPDLKNSPEAVGFGYDAASGDYKLVTFSSNYSHRHRAKLWTMSSNCWKDVSDALIGFNMDTVFPHGMLLPHANKLYWHATGSNYDTHAFLSFDMTDDTFQLITLPSDITSSPAFVYIDLIHNMGSLALSVLHLNEGIHSFDIWVMDDNNNNGYWTKRFSNINVRDHIFHLRFSISSDMLILESFDKLRLLSYLILYDPHSKEEKQICPCPGYHIPDQPWSYIESLVSAGMTSL